MIGRRSTQFFAVLAIGGACLLLLRSPRSEVFGDLLRVQRLPFQMDTVRLGNLPTPRALELERWHGAADDFGVLTSIVVEDEFIFVSDLGYRPHGAMIDRTSGQLVARFPDAGHAAFDWQDLRIVGVRDSGTSLSVLIWDARRNEIAEVDPSQSFEDQMGSATRVPSGLSQLRAPALLGDTLAFPGYFLNDALLLTDLNAVPLLLVGGAPPVPMPTRLEPRDLRGILNSAEVATTATSGQRRVAVAHQQSDRLQLFDFQSLRGTVVLGPDSLSPSYVVRNGTPVFLPEHRRGYTNVAATSTHVYALYSGRPRGGASAREIRVFTWSGQLDAIITLDYPIQDLAVVAEEGLLFGLVSEFDQRLARVGQWTLPGP